MEFEVANRLNAEPGDVVILSIPEEGVLTASIVMYFVPLVLMSLFAMAASHLWLNEFLTVLSGIVGLAMGFGAARHYSQKHKDDPRFSPSMTGLALASPVGSACA